MPKKKSQQVLVTDEEKRLALEAATRKVFSSLGFDPSSLDRKIEFGSSGNLSPEQEHEFAKIMGLQIAAAATIEKVAPTIHTQEDLDKAVRELSGSVERAPTVARENLDQIRSGLRRRGGLGRQPLLTDHDSMIVCESILHLHGKKKYKIKPALAEVSRLCPELLGKEVGPRTLQKKWNDRDLYLGRLPENELKELERRLIQITQLKVERQK